MKNKLVKLLSLFACGLLAVGFTACTTPEPTHEHGFYMLKGEFAATCTEDGYILYECECGATEKSPTFSALGHDFGDANNYVSNNDATCLADGTETATCLRDGCNETHTRIDQYSKLDHSYTNYVYDGNATCSEYGTKTAVCDTDGCNETDTCTDYDTPKPPHPYADTWSYDSAHHWHDSTCDCKKTADSAPHTDDGKGYCSSCKLTLGMEFAAQAGYYGITDYTGTATHVIIPEKINGITVTGILNSCFYNDTTIKEITIPASIKSFNTSFKKCTALETVYYQGTLEQWLNLSFPTSNFNPMIAAEHLYINGEEITEITIPDSITEIDLDVLVGINDLTSINVSDSHPTYASQSGILYNKAKTEFSFIPYNLSGDIIIPKGITAIGAAWFAYTDITGVTFEENSQLTSIGEYAFRGCKQLKNITLPEGVTTIGDEAFRECKQLKNITLPEGVTTIEDDAFFDCTALNTISLPNSLTFVGNNAFYNCPLQTIGKDGLYYLGNETNPYVYLKAASSLTTASIENGCKIIGYHALYQNSLLAEVTIPNSVVSIGGWAFWNCIYLTNVTIPDSVTYIGEQAFAVSALESVTMGNSVAYIGENAFERCSQLTGVYITDLAAWCNITFVKYYSNPLYYAKNLYLNNSLVTQLYIPDSVTEIKAYAFVNCSSIEWLFLGNNTASIGDYAFMGCSNLLNLHIAPALTYIGNYAFKDCTNFGDVFTMNGANWNNVTKGTGWKENTQILFD